MSTTIEEPTTASAEELAERLFGSALGAMEMYTVYLGERLGLYAALAEHGPCTSEELAGIAGVHPRYSREWLEQQSVAGFVHCTDRTQPADARQFELPVEHVPVLLDPSSPVYTASLALAVTAVGGVATQLVEAYRTGAGVPYAAYGTDFRDGQAGFNRPAFDSLLAGEWLSVAVPEVHARLVAGEPVTIADIGCGAGWSSIALARAYPRARVDGFDLDDASIADARRNAASVGVADRVRFEVADAAALPASSYDLVCILEALHDMSAPVAALSAARAMAPITIVMDERTADSFAESAGPVEAFLYGASVLHCLPVGMAAQPSAATGTVMRVETMHEYATAAGFERVEVLPIEHDLFRFYRCT